MVKTNKEKLVQISVQGEIAHPQSLIPYRIKNDGEAVTLPGTGGITYNVKVGDPAFGFVADHVEPGVSIKLQGESNKSSNGGLNFLACVGNTARVVSGDAKGVEGVVTGKHGGIEHVLVYFPHDKLDQMSIGDKILIKSWGVGLEIEGFPQVKTMNLDPELFEKMSIEEKDGCLEVPVAAEVPAYLMGSGIGAISAARGDYDIMTGDQETIRELGLDKLRFGDIVLLKDCDTSYGRGYVKGAATIGVVVHSNCVISGHGPGVTTLLTSRVPVIKGRISSGANIADILKLK